MGEIHDDDDEIIQWSEARCKATGDLHIFPTYEKHDFDDECYCCPIINFYKNKYIVRHHAKTEAH